MLRVLASYCEILKSVQSQDLNQTFLEFEKWFQLPLIVVRYASVAKHLVSYSPKGELPVMIARQHVLDLIHYTA